VIVPMGAFSPHSFSQGEPMLQCLPDMRRQLPGSAVGRERYNVRGWPGRPLAWGHIKTATAPAASGPGIGHDEVVPESRRPAVGMDALAVWCRRWLGAPPAAELFEAGYLSTVKGLRLADGREVVVKVRPCGPRLAGCAVVHRALWAAGFPCPEPLVDLQPLDGYAATAETLVLDVGEPPPDSELAVLSAAALARLVELAPDPGPVPSLAPSPSWAGWDHTEPGLWPEPEDRDVDLNACPGPRWLDRVAAAVRDRLRGHTSDLVIGHGDWHPENLRWHGRQLIAVHDWDSVICQPEPAIAGLAAASFLGIDGPAGMASVEDSAAFLDGYQQARGRRWRPQDYAACWAAGLWQRAFDAKTRSLDGDPGQILTRHEARARLRLAGLNPGLAAEVHQP
jgi:Phosphotransferase enzyme family